MQFINALALWAICMELFSKTSALSFHQPKLSPCASWNSVGITFANNSTIAQRPLDIFIDITNTIYVADNTNNNIQIWDGGSNNLTRRISGNLNSPNSFFVTTDGDIYIDNGNHSRVDKWSPNPITNISVMYVNRGCIDLFMDVNKTLYCSIDDGHRVVKMSFDDGANRLTTVAGIGCAGSAPNMLDRSCGIFVDTNFDLYVADTGNNRIQQFSHGKLNGITVAGFEAAVSYPLYRPTSVTLDADGNLFIVDSDRHRIISSSTNGFRCLVGCSGVSGSAPDQLNNPWSLAFDSYGNMFVTDMNNDRIQMFVLATNSCDQTTISQKQTSTSKKSEIFTTQFPQVSTSTQHLVSNQSCFPPIITLFPDTSSLIEPAQFRRSEDFYISSYLDVNCTDSLSVITQWTIFYCTPTCSLETKVNKLVKTKLSELFIPARTLAYGIYELKLTVTMAASRNLNSSASAYVQINRSNITANLLQFGTSMITSDQGQNLTLDPGSFSINPDAITFNASDWTYQYQCRLYDSNNLEHLQAFNTTNNSCFSNRTNNRARWQYGSMIPPESSVTILAGSLRYNQTYQFVVHMINRQNSTFQAYGFLIVKVDNTGPQKVAISCVISTMCSSDREYQFINPSTQVALVSVCVNNCILTTSIKWNIYKGSMNLSTNITKWTQMNSSQNNYFFGLSTSNLTAINKLFDEKWQVDYWRFEVIYTFVTMKTSLSALNFVINQRPRNGSCSISPRNGTTNTLFTINCSNWLDDNGIKDYSFYGWTRNKSERIMLAYTTLSIVKIRLPANNDNTSLLRLTAHVRDMLNCVAEFDLEPLVVVADLTEINTLIDTLQKPSNGATGNSYVRLLASRNQNTVAQVIILLMRELNRMNKLNIETAIATGGISATSISVSPLGSERSQFLSVPLNMLAMTEYNQKLNTLANMRDYLIRFTSNLAITTVDSITLQASMLAQLTEATNQLTQTALIIAMFKCHQLSLALQAMATKIAYENAQFAATHIAQCVNNVLTAINGPLQQREDVLDLDSIRADIFPDDYDIDFELIWSNLKELFLDGNDFSWETIEKDQHLYYQTGMLNKITAQATEALATITATLNIHLNIGQSTIINTPAVFMSLERATIASLSTKHIKQVGNAQIKLPSKFDSNLAENTSVLIRSIMQPLASAGASRSLVNTSLSTSISLSLIGRDGNEISIDAHRANDSIEFFIPRDPNLHVPPMFLQNVTSIRGDQPFHLHFVNMAHFLANNNITVSVHFEIRPLNRSIGYLFIYKFDSAPQLSSSINRTDGWSLLCPSNLTNDSIYTYFIDNRRTSHHQSVIFGLRELNSTEIKYFCSNVSINSPPITDKPFNFTSDYELRVYTSGCYYLDADNNWQSYGLWVGPKTNHNQTQCFSTHLTTFASSYMLLSAPVNMDIHLDDFFDIDSNLSKLIQMHQCSHQFH